MLIFKRICIIMIYSGDLEKKPLCGLLFLEIKIGKHNVVVRGEEWRDASQARIISLQYLF